MRNSVIRLIFTCTLCMTVMLGGCQHRSVEQSPTVPGHPAFSLKSYPAMEGFRFENITFGFALKLAALPTEIQATPQQIDIDKTIQWNLGGCDPEAASKLRTLLENLKRGRMSAVAVNGVKNRIYALTGPSVLTGEGTEQRQITYSLETTSNLEMLSLRKETRMSKGYLQKYGFDKKEFFDSLIASYGQPDYRHVKANGNGTFSHYWWGAGEEILLAGDGYDSLDASHWNGYRGKTFFVSIHQYGSGDLVVGKVLKDNARAMRNLFGN